MFIRVFFKPQEILRYYGNTICELAFYQNEFTFVYKNDGAINLSLGR